MSDLTKARDIMTWVDEDPAGRSAEGLKRLTALGSTDQEVRDIGEELAMMADYFSFAASHPKPGS